jgi:hypothetical protein
MVTHTYCIRGMETPQIQHILSENQKVSQTQYETLWHTTVAKERKTNSNIFVTYLEEIQEKVAKNLEDPTRGGGGIQEDSQLQSIKAQYVDPGKKGSREGVVADEILHHNRGSAMGNERLEGGMEGSSGANKIKQPSKVGSSQKKSTPVGNTRKASSAHEADRGEHNNKNT